MRMMTLFGREQLIINVNVQKRWSSEDLGFDQKRNWICKNSTIIMKWYGLKHGLKTLVMVTFVKRLILLLPGSVLLSDKRLKFASTTENVVIIMKRHENSNWTNLRSVESAKNQFLEKTKMGQFEKGKSVAWIFNMNDLNLPCSSKLLHNKAISYWLLHTTHNSLRVEDGYKNLSTDTVCHCVEELH